MLRYSAGIWCGAIVLGWLGAVSPVAAQQGVQQKAVQQQQAAQKHKYTESIAGDPQSDVVDLRGRLVDLSHTYNADTIFWPTEKGFRLERGPAGVTDKGYYYSANRFWTPEHGGTHVDAPIHFFAGGKTVDQIPLGRLIGPAVVVDVRDKCAADRDYLIGVEDLQGWETANNDTLDGKIVLLRTGFAQYWPDRQKYLGTTETGRQAVAKLHFPGLDPKAAQWLTTRRKVRAVGIDTASIDYGQSTQFGSHVALCGHDVPFLENVASMDALPASGFSLIALPMKIGGGSGGPTRVVAVVPE